MESYDVIIVGGGAAGLSAAAAAAENGAGVLILESKKKLGGNGIFPMGIYGVDSPVQKRNLIFASTEDAFLSCMEYSHWKLDGRLVRTIINKSGDTIAWLEQMGVPFSGLMHHVPNQTPEVFHIVAPPNNAGRVIVDVLCSRLEELGVTALTDIRATKLIQRGGRVCGVRAVQPDGSEVSFEGQSVIVATGGFGGNAEMIRRYFPNYNPDNFLHMHGIRHNGDGISMCLEAGADVDEGFAMEKGAPKIIGHAPINLLLSKPFAVWLNQDGERFTRESNVYNFSDCANACSRQPNGVVFVLLDQRLKDLVLQTGRDPLERLTIPQDAEQKLEPAIAQAQNDGLLCVANTLEEAAGFIGCPNEALADTIAQYNACCGAGYDAFFAKRREDLIPLGQPPYYIIRAGVDMIATHGGIRVNHRFQALDLSRSPIPGLYVAGVDMGGVDADVYNMTMSGHAFGFAVNSGRLAGEDAAQAVQ